MAAQRAARQELTGGLTAAQQKGVQALVRVINDLRQDVRSKGAEDVLLKSLVQRVYSSGVGVSKKKDKDDDQLEAAKLVAAMARDLAVTEGLDDDIGAGAAALTASGGGGGTGGGGGGGEGAGSGGAASGGAATARKLLKFVKAVKSLDKEGLKKMRESEVVRLSTIHMAKGLEFSHVWLVQMADGVCPLRPTNLDHIQDEEQMQTALDDWLQEERRVAYVALTRAKKYLNISWLSRDAQTGEHLEPSRFIVEIPDAFKISAREAAAQGDAARVTPATTPATARGSSCAPAALSMASVARAAVAGVALYLSLGVWC